MGCDIHLYVERLDHNNKWNLVEYDYSLSPDWMTWKRTDHSWYVCRNYILFGILAGVRSNFIKPPILPRGIPKKICSKIRYQYKRWGSDGHTASHIYLNELLKFEEYKFFTKMYSYIDDQTLEIYSSIYKPFKSKNIPIEKLNKLKKLITFSDNKSDINKFHSEEVGYFSISEFISEFWSKYIPAFKKIDTDPSKVRLIFWFDN